MNRRGPEFSGSLVRLPAILLIAAGWMPDAGAADRVDRLVMDDQRQTATFVSGAFERAIGETDYDVATRVIGVRSELYQLQDASRELVVRREQRDRLGYAHLRLNQVKDGIPVWGCQQVAHFDADGTLYLIAGQSVPTPDVSLTPTISQFVATADATQQVATLTGFTNLQADAELVVVPDDDRTRLAWYATVTRPGNNGFRRRVMMDAHTGEFLLVWDDIPTDGPTIGNGLDVLGFNQIVNTYDQGGVFRLIDATHPMYAPPVDSLTGVIVTYDNWRNEGPVTTDPNGDNVWNDVPALKAAISGHHYTRITYEYFLNTFGLNSYDDSGTSIIVGVHDSTYVNNAFWGLDGSINFSDGDGVNFLPFSGDLDVVAHELAHGISVHIPGLIYLFEAGALHEHYSDFFGVMVDRDDWFIAENITLQAPGFIRSVQDPGATGQPDHMSEYLYLPATQDAGGAHTNSGIGNRAGYLVSAMLDRERAEQIWFRAWTVYLTPNASYPFFSLSTLQAARDLYGDPSPELAAVTLAMDSVGLGGVYASPAQVSPIPLVQGTSFDTTLTVYNLGSNVVTLDSAATSRSELVLTGTFPVTLDLLDTALFALAIDATGLTGPCDLGQQDESVTFYTSSGAWPTINVPVTVQLLYVDTDPRVDTFTASCVTLEVPNTPGLDQFSLNGEPGLFDGTFMVGLIDGTDTTLYWDVYDPGNFVAVDTFVTDLPEVSRERKSLRFTTTDNRIQGRLEYTYEIGAPGSCNFVLADYVLINQCDTAFTALAGLFADFHLPGWTLNHVDVDASRPLIIQRDDQDTRACGILNLGITSPRNLRAVNNPALIWDGFTPAEAYGELAPASDVESSHPDDWSSLLTFDQWTLAPGDSVSFHAALIYSDSGSAGVKMTASTLLGEACPILITGDVNETGTINSADIIYMVNYIFKTGPDPTPLAVAGDVNCDASQTSADVIYLVNHVFKGGPEPCDVCSIFP